MSSQVFCQQDTLYPKSHVAFTTENKDTLYVERSMYSLLKQVWEMPKNADEKPVIIPVDSVEKFYAIKEED